MSIESVMAWHTCIIYIYNCMHLSNELLMPETADRLSRSIHSVYMSNKQIELMMLTHNIRNTVGTVIQFALAEIMPYTMYALGHYRTVDYGLWMASLASLASLWGVQHCSYIYIYIFD